jgi:hypothetical protein
MSLILLLFLHVQEEGDDEVTMFSVWLFHFPVRWLPEKIFQSSFLCSGFCREDGEESFYGDEESKIGVWWSRSEIEGDGCGV